MPRDGNVKWVVLENRIPKIIQGMEGKADAIVRKAALDIQAEAMRRAPVDTGTLRASIQARRVKRAHWRVSVGVHYGIYQEYGTVHSPAHPFMRPAVRAVQRQFRQAMKAVVQP